MSPEKDAEILKQISLTQNETNEILNSQKNRIFPNADEINKLNLQLGQNIIEFKAGNNSVNANIWVWNWDIKLIISDIDGTITKSDFMGNVMPLFGNDWSQPGVARLFTEINNNGYQFIYLSARSIGLANRTKNYLSSIKQEKYTMPSGPVIVSPDLLFTALKREVIHRKPQQFKIPTLKIIQGLFPEHYNPFFAAYGNRDTDIITYMAVGIKSQNVYIVNKEGIVVCTNLKSATTYLKMIPWVFSYFPLTTLIPIYKKI